MYTTSNKNFCWKHFNWTAQQRGIPECFEWGEWAFVMILSWVKQVQRKDEWGTWWLMFWWGHPGKESAFCSALTGHGPDAPWSMLVSVHFKNKVQLKNTNPNYYNDIVQEQPVFFGTLSVEHVRNAISGFHALSDWKVVSRELTKNVPIFLVLVMLCYFVILQCFLFGLYVYIYVYVMRKLGFSLNLKFLKYWKFSVSVTKRWMPSRLLHRYTYWPFEIV